MPHTLLIEPFDITLHDTPLGRAALQSRFAAWLRTLNGPARFLSWQMPADLNEKIKEVSVKARATTHPQRQGMQQEYRRFYQDLNRVPFQRSVAGMVVWNEDQGSTLANVLGGVFGTEVKEAPLPPLFKGQYRLARSPFWHLAPAGASDGRPYYTVLSSYEFVPAVWHFFRPLMALLDMNYPLTVCVDIPETYERNTAVNKVEGVIQAYKVHLSNLRGQEDSQGVRRVQDCYRALGEINAGHALHRVSVHIAVAADDLETLQKRAQEIVAECKSWFALRYEVGELLSKSVSYFSAASTKSIGLPATTHPVTSPELAMMFAPVGCQKLGSLRGTLRGLSFTGGHPVFHDSFRDKRVVHEVWVGMPGFGKTFGLLCYLNRLYAEDGIPFDYLEPMGHGRYLARAFGIEPYIISAKKTCLNPQDVMFPTLVEQISHTIHLYETILRRELAGDQLGNLQRSLLAQALEEVYAPWLERWEALTPDVTPTCSDVCEVLTGLGQTERMRVIARDFADELGGLCTGSGPFATFVDGHTQFDFGSGSSAEPRIFCFHELEGDPVLIALAYAFTLSTLHRDSLKDENPRVIAVDEVYRLMKQPTLLDFLIEAAKTFRTRRKKLIVIDQNMMFFLQGKARYIFENCPIRVIFSQQAGLGVFTEDAAFSHFNQRHVEIIRDLQRFQFLLDIQDEGTWALHSIASQYELARFGST